MNQACVFCKTRQSSVRVCAICQIAYCTKEKCVALHFGAHMPKEREWSAKSLRTTFPATVDAEAARRLTGMSADDGDLVVHCTGGLKNGCMVSLEFGSISEAVVGGRRACKLNLTVPIREIAPLSTVIDPRLDIYCSAYMQEAMKRVQIRAGVSVTYMELVATYGDALLIIVDPSILARLLNHSIDLIKFVGSNF